MYCKIFYITDLYGCKSNFLILCEQMFLRAFLAVSAEEESLPAMIANALVDLTLQISALSITL